MATRPKANADELTLKEADVLSGNVLGNDTPGSDGKLFLRFFNGDKVLAKQNDQVTEITGQYGTFHVKADGTFDYVLSDTAKSQMLEGQTYTETITYKISDGSGNTSQSSLKLNIVGKAGPVAANDEFKLDESETITGNILSNDIPAENGQLLLRSIAGQSFDAAHPTVDVVGDHGIFHFSANGTFTYELNEDLAFGETITETVRYYKVSDGSGNTDSAKLTLTVTGTEYVSGETESVRLTGVTEDLSAI